MSLGIFADLPRPFFALAPMADVTDPAFRRIVAKYGKPDLLWTEFVAADGLASPGRDHLLRDLVYSEEERPIIAQVFGAHPEKMREAVALVAGLGFDGIDINMGCPDRAIERQKAGAAMIQDPENAARIIAAAKKGIEDSGRDIPLSVKTRVGWNVVALDTWIPHLLAQDIAALTIHARTRKEMSKVPARWEHVAEVVAIRDRMGVATKIIGNGDVQSVADGKCRAEETGADGVMIGRAIFGAPWLFSSRPEPTIRERFAIAVEHAYLHESLVGGHKSFALLKKHFRMYVHGWDGAKELRTRIMDEGEDAATIEQILGAWGLEHPEMLDIVPGK